MKRVFNIVIAALAICVTSSTLVAGQDKKIEQKIKIIKN